MDQKFLDIACKEAEKSSEPIKSGCVIVQNNKIISKSYNSQRQDNNATHHAEIKTIVKAGKTLNSKNLYNCTIYSTCEPCTMCLSALVFAKIKRLIFHTSLKDLSKKRIDISTETFLKHSHYRFEVEKCTEYKNKSS